MEQRQFQRVHFFQRVQVKTNDHVYETHCLDVSMRGLLLVRPENVDWKLEQRLHVTLTLTEDQIIEMDCSLVHIDEDFVGCVCDSLDLDSMIVLRRLLELNLVDPKAINRELAELIRSNALRAD